MPVRFRNQDEVLIQPSKHTATEVNPFVFNTNEDIARFPAPFRGEVVKVVSKVAVAGTAGAGHIQTISIENGGSVDGTGTTPLTTLGQVKNAATIPVGTIVESFGNGVVFERGDILKFRAEETGTPGGTDAQAIILGALLRRHGTDENGF